MMLKAESPQEVQSTFTVIMEFHGLRKIRREQNTAVVRR